MSRTVALLLTAMILAASPALGAGTFVAVSTETGANVPNAESLTTGTTWSSTSISTARALGAVAYGNGIFCATGAPSLTVSYYSADGVTWNIGGSVGHAAGVIGYGAGVFTVWDSGVNYNETSLDCITWTSPGTAVPAGSGATAMVWDAVHSVFFMLNGPNQNYWTSSDGKTWTYHSGGFPAQAGGIASCGGTTIALYAANANVSTNGGASWTNVSIGSGGYLSQVACSDATHFVAVGSGGRVYHSTDGGTTWTGAAGVLGSLNPAAVAWNGAQYVVVAASTTSFGHSADGVTWTLESTGAVSLAAPALAASTGSASPAVSSRILGNGLL